MGAGRSFGTSSSELDLPVRTGEVCGGKFRVERIIGEGPFGLVAEATDLDVERRVSLHFLHRDACARPEVVERFVREARAAANIRSDHVARILDVGGVDAQCPFIVREQLDGVDLELVIARHAPIDVTEAAEWIIQACEGLSAAHALGIAHRELNPANLLRVEREGTRQIKLLDVGISKAAVSGDGEDDALLESNVPSAVEASEYLAPEQLRGMKDVDVRADVWALGVILYELISGERPFAGRHLTAPVAKVLYEPHRPVRWLLADVPQGIEAIIDHCLQKDRERRYQAAADLAVALLPFAPKRARAVVERAKANKASMAAASAPPARLPAPLPRDTTEPPKSNGTPALSVSSRPSAPPQNTYAAWLAVACMCVGLTGAVLALGARFRDHVARSSPVANGAPPAPVANDAPPAPTRTTSPFGAPTELHRGVRGAPAASPTAPTADAATSPPVPGQNASSAVAPTPADAGD